MNRIISLVVIGTLGLSGCASPLQEVNRTPDLTPVRTDIGASYGMTNGSRFPSQPENHKYSLWEKRSTSFFRDPRATNPGDVLTVNISINDKANLDNKSGRQRVSSSLYGLGGEFSTSGGSAGDFSGSLNSKSDSRSTGQGVVERKEEIRLSIAAIVTDILPNGNLVISGSQEVRVNNELRVLNVAGVVRPRDISGYNTISYDKIAEARISYGGRGRISEIQQPPYGQQILDQISPF
ncbi:flagellar basal body L-ring protein FlgH [Phyllobacterium salinisoli]|uniref:Flagellar L-ring protein n=1 Tax=Phyllobacterium salinisoli TaxID=1899321 RepID=A0A368K3K6_9HYPH|nr:flagellar basal body L-ring protein FlgH [Phyllobacterium salinisoli]RCS23976.1 flagellar basal body L-ring protein FlgH [Phyllobacterium salinisoli]